MLTEPVEFREWSPAAVRLLKGVIDADDGAIWSLVVSNVSQLEAYFGRLGLRLVIDQSEGLAYLRQYTDEEGPEGYDALPRLFHSTRLSYGQTLLCVLLRDEFRRFEEEDLHNGRCVIDEQELFDQWKAFHPTDADEVKIRRDLVATLRKLEAIGFVRPFGDTPAAWEVRRVLKARLPAAELENLREQLLAAVARRQPQDGRPSEDE
jgi:hypothetical protein